MIKKESPNDHLTRHDRELSKIRNEKLLPVTEQHEGLMQAQDKSDLIHAQGTRVWISEKTSVLNLGPNNYETTWNNLTDTPIPANEVITSYPPLCEIDVKRAISGQNTRTQIWFYSSVTGEVWYRNTHESSAGVNNAPQLWQKVRKEAVLWQGSIQNTNTSITLADSLANYSSLIIGFGALAMPKFEEHTINGNITIRDSNQAADDNRWLAHYETVLTNNGNKTMTIKQATGVLRNADGSTAIDTNKIGITEIRGVR